MAGQLAVLWVGTVALALLFGSLRVAVPQYQAGDASLTGLIGYAFSLLFWILFAFHSTAYVRPLGSGTTQVVNTPSFALVGLIGTITCLLLLFDAATRVISGAR